MGIFFTVGEKKKRAGVYQRYENIGGVQTAGATDGVVAVCVRSNWGELNKVYTFEDIDAVKNTLGDGGSNGTVDILTEIFTGRATKVYCVRLGSGGTNGSVILQDKAAKIALTVHTKCPGNRKFNITLRDVLGEANKKEFILYEGTVELERFHFSTETNEMKALLEAGKKSKYCNFIKEVSYMGDGKLASVTQKEFAMGVNPTVTTADYSNAFTALEPYFFNVICVDTDDIAVHTILSAYVNRVYQGGKMCFGVIGEPTTVAFETRLSHARSYNDYNIIYVGGGTIQATGETLEGYKMAARIAGRVAAIPSNQSLTHKTISGAVDVVEKLTNSQYEQTIDAGMLTFSVSNGGNVWIESGITTLNNLEAEDDEGWKKIKRSKVRFELMNRANDTVEPLIGNISNNTDGRATVIQAIQALLNTMVIEDKLLAGAVIELDKNNPPQGDSAWFNITADDVDSLEKIYFVFKFRFATTVS